MTLFGRAQFSWQLGEIGPATFNAETPGFADLTEILTNGSDNLLSAFLVFKDVNGNIMGGGGTGNMESQWFGGQPDLLGREIQFVRANVVMSFIQGSEGGNLYFTSVSNVQWEFWGTGISIPAVPDSTSTLTLIGSAMFGLASLRRWGNKSGRV